MAPLKMRFASNENYTNDKYTLNNYNIDIYFIKSDSADNYAKNNVNDSSDNKSIQEIQK